MNPSKGRMALNNYISHDALMLMNRINRIEKFQPWNQSDGVFTASLDFTLSPCFFTFNRRTCAKWNLWPTYFLDQMRKYFHKKNSHFLQEATSTWSQIHYYIFYNFSCFIKFDHEISYSPQMWCHHKHIHVHFSDDLRPEQSGRTELL